MLDAGRDVRMESFVGGAMKAFAINLAEAEKAEATMQKHMEDLGGIQNIVKLPMEQRGAVEDFLRTNRDEYNTLAEQYEKTKDPAIKDQMNAIKFKFETLNNQLGQFATSKAEYMYDYEEGNLMKGGTFAKDNAFYMGIYGDPNAQFSINETGEISFTVNGETRAFKDVGSHTLRNYEGEKNIDTLFGAAADLKVQGKFFDKARFANNFVNGHKSITKNDLKALLQTDLTGDGDKPSFMDQWASGGLADEFYQGVDKNNIKPEDVEALLNDKQRGLDLMGKYVGNISEGIYGNTDTDPSVLLNNRYKQAQIDAMNKKSNNQKNTTSSSVLNSGFQIQNRSLSKEVGNNIIYEIQNKGVARNPIDGMEYYWKGDGWYDSDNKKVADDTDKLTRDIFGIQDNRFNGLTPGTYNENAEDDDTWKRIYTGGDTETSNKINEKYGLTSGNENIMFVPYGYDGGSKLGKLIVSTFRSQGFTDYPDTNDMMAINPIDKTIYLDENNQPIKFKSRDSDGWNDEIAIQQLKEIQDLIRKAGVNVPSGSGPIVINNQQGGRT